MSKETSGQSILDMARGAIKERVDYEMARVMDNILDPNTNPTKERSLTVTVKFKPDTERQQISVQAVAKSKLEPTNPVATALYITGDQNGEASAVEMVPQVPGQQSIDGTEEDEPKMLRLIKQA